MELGKEKVLIFDGAMGTMLWAAGLASGECPESYNLVKPEVVASIHLAYIAAGAEIIETNTFGANSYKLAKYGLADRVNEINKAGVQIAKRAAGKKALVAAAIGATGLLSKPSGDTSFDDYYQLFFEQISALAEAGPDLILLETMSDLSEAKAAVIAAKAACNLPIICQMTYEENETTLMGQSPELVAQTLELLGVTAIGVNCSSEPAQILKIVQRYRAVTDKPLTALPNAGIPEMIGDEVVYKASPADMAAWVKPLAEAGAVAIGGCCGTTPAHIAAMKQAVAEVALQPKNPPYNNAVLTGKRSVYNLSLNTEPLVVVNLSFADEPILLAELEGQKTTAVGKLVKALAKGGAGAIQLSLDKLPEIPLSYIEELILKVQKACDLPLIVNMAEIEQAEAALKCIQGISVLRINISESERIGNWLALAVHYGQAVLIAAEQIKRVPASPLQKQNIYQLLSLDEDNMFTAKASVEKHLQADATANLAVDLTALDKNTMNAAYQELKALKIRLVIIDYQSWLEREHA